MGVDEAATHSAETYGEEGEAGFAFRGGMKGNSRWGLLGTIRAVIGRRWVDNEEEVKDAVCEANVAIIRSW